MISALVYTRDWCKAEHTLSSRASKTPRSCKPRQNKLAEEYGSVWSKIIHWCSNALSWINGINVWELNQVLRNNSCRSGLRKHGMSHFKVEEMLGYLRGPKKASVDQEEQEKQLQLYSACFCRGPGWRSLDDSRGKQRKNLRRKKQSLISPWGYTRWWRWFWSGLAGLTDRRRISWRPGITCCNKMC